MYEREFYWRDFSKAVNIELSNKLKLLHVLYEKRNDAIFNIKDNIEEYNKIGIDVSKIFDLNNGDKIIIGRKKGKGISVRLYTYLSSYNYLIYERIPEIQSDIKALAAVKNCPREMYMYFQDALNFEIQRHIIDGYSYSFSPAVGYVRAIFFKIPPEKMLNHINWGDTMALRKKLLDAGIAIRTKDNPNGTPYIIYADWDWWIRAQYHKNKGRIQESRYYKFRFGYVKNNVPPEKRKIDKSPKTYRTNNINDIIYNDKLSLENKLLMICVNFPDKRSTYHTLKN